MRGMDWNGSDGGIGPSILALKILIVHVRVGVNTRLA